MLLLTKHLSVIDKRVMDLIYCAPEIEATKLQKTTPVSRIKDGILELLVNDPKIQTHKLVYIALKIVSKDLKNTRASLAETMRYTSVKNI